MMYKKILLPVLLLISSLSLAQNNPVLLSYDVSGVCENDYGATIALNIAVQDIDNDSTYIIITGYDGSLFTWVEASTPAYDPGADTRYFELFVDVSFGVPVGTTYTEIGIEIIGNSTLDPGTTSESLTDLSVSSLPVIDGSVFASNIFCSNDLIDISSMFSPAGGEFYWGVGEGPVFDVGMFSSAMIEVVDYYYTDPATGCMAYDSQSPTVADHPIISVAITDATCGSNDGAVNATITSGSGPFDVYWSTGLSETVSSVSSITSLNSGMYYINVVDQFGCKNVQVAPVADNVFSVTPNITNETCNNESMNGAIDLAVTLGSGTVTSYFWNNGEATEDITGLSIGEYTVQIHTDEDCHFYGVYNVDAPPKLSYIDYNILPTSCFSTPSGEITYTTVGGTAPYTWMWNTLDESEDLYTLTPGEYTCIITDANGCTDSVYGAINTWDGPDIYLNGILESECGGTTGYIDVDVYAWGPPISTMNWDVGPTTEDLADVGPGTYTLTVKDDAGCIVKSTFEVGAVQPTQPEFCMLTVDTSLIYNTLVWEKEFFPDADGFRIYRETGVYGEYEMIHEQVYGDVSSFKDNEVNPNDRSWRYRISSYNTCGEESYGSFIHKTIHVVYNTADMINYVISWDDYEGIDYTDVTVHRHDNSTGWTDVATVPYGTNTYPDTPPEIAGLDYMITFNLTETCTSSKAEGADYNSVRSNKTHTGIHIPGGDTDPPASQIQDEIVGLTILFPNPANDEVTIRIDHPEMFNDFRVMDLNGKVILHGSIDSNINILDISRLEQGMYYVELSSDQKTIVHRLVKQ